MPYPPLVEALLQPEAYPERPQRVVLLETHISYLFLTGPTVYKVKKPVNFGFLDFTTPDKRRFFCLEEVRLNRRLSPDVYLGVVEIRQEGGRFAVEGRGQTIEYAVKMRQLPGERAMSYLLRRGELTRDMVVEVARRIASFHRAAETGEEINRLGSVESVRFNVQENFSQTERYIGKTISAGDFLLLKAYSEAFLEGQASLFARRIADGRVRDCHGDLHTAQVFFSDGIQIIDCIEFNQRFRFGDVAVDMAFLAMDLDYHGRPDLSRAFVEAYVGFSGDAGLLQVLDFYKVYRAYVRGKVEGFRLEGSGLSSRDQEEIQGRARRYFDLAASFVRPLLQPMLLTTTGLMGTGKSTLAEGLAQSLGAALLSSDVMRKELAGIAPGEHRYVPWGKGVYSAEATESTYQALLASARVPLQEGKAVILDASFRETRWRQEARRLAERFGIPFRIVECHCPDEVVRRRLEERQGGGGGPSDGRWELYRQQREAFDPVTEVASEQHLVVDTSGGPSEALFQVLNSLFRSRLEGTPRMRRGKD